MRSQHLKLLIALCLLLQACFRPKVEESPQKDQIIAKMTATLIRQEPDFAYKTVSEYLEILTQKRAHILIDARQDHERDVSIIKNALSQQQWNQLSSETAKDQLIIVYDTLGYRSIALLKDLQKNGFTNAHYLAGGILAWSHAKQDFYDGKKNIKKVHVSSKAWSLLPEGYEGIYD